ncbi:hypothetical protein LIER_07866 [Lithospermum erythrorhizon]|uniref:FAD-binding PCMH-type domain-containing protein n=1 Tax=Lithospermum erythrorhizon TaxID=34254 RepID=A0AAV3P9N7_LITER
MRNSTICFGSFFLSTILLIVSADESFQKCLENEALPSQPISQVIYIPQNNISAFSSVLQNYVKNLRFNESTTRKPELIITALHVSHIQAAVICSKKHGLQMKIRSGGHDYEGISYVSTGPFFILDMFNLRAINVSIEDETAWVQTGAILGEVYYRIAEKSNVHGFPAGVCPTVGVGGHISGGGYGNMLRKFGLTIDNILDAEIIDAKGRLLDRKSMGEDLFWAISGGGGASFGVVLSYKIKLVRVPEIVTVFRVGRTYEQNATDLAYKWQRIADKLDDDLFIRMIFDVINNTQTGDRTNRVQFLALFLGDSDRLLSIMNQSFPELGLQRSDCIETSWLQSVLYFTNIPLGTEPEILLRRGTQGVTYLKRKSDYLEEPMSKEGLEFIFKKMIELVRPSMVFNPYGGKMAEIPSHAKPFPHRAGNIAKIQYAANWNEAGTEFANFYLNLTNQLFDYMTPYVSKNPREAFLNYRDLDIGINQNESPERSFIEGAVYGVKYFKENYPRLVKIKTKVDPHNLFRNEQSIPVFPFGK